MTNHTPDWYQPPSNAQAGAGAEPLEIAPLPQQPLYRSPKTNRRGFLALAAATGAAAVGGAGYLLAHDAFPRSTAKRDGDASSEGGAANGGSDVDMTSARPLAASADVAGRTLVVVELQGGNDGLATLVPRNAGVLYDQRGDLHIDDSELLDFTDEFGWNPNLAGLAGHSLAALVGLGSTHSPDGSHFEMERRWWSGKSAGGDLPFTGFFGRLCDQLVTDQPVTGVSIGSNASPALRSEHAVTVGLRDMNAGWFLHSDEPFYSNMRRTMAAMAGGSDSADDMSSAASERLSRARAGLSDTLNFGRSLVEVDEERIQQAYPQTELGGLFGAASELIKQDAGIRIIHLTHGGFDTHSDQLGTHNYLLEQLGDAMGSFLTDLDDSGLSDSTLVCTTSEFGRRVANNRGGTDHGEAGMAILSGPVTGGVHGEAPSLTSLNDGNLATTVDFEQYYATIAEQWFGIPSSEVIESGASPIDGLIAT